jgi:hypothetical protein
MPETITGVVEGVLVDVGACVLVAPAQATSEIASIITPINNIRKDNLDFFLIAVLSYASQFYLN